VKATGSCTSAECDVDDIRHSIAGYVSHLVEEAADTQMQGFLKESGSIKFKSYSWNPGYEGKNQAIIKGIAWVLKANPAARLQLKGVQSSNDGRAPEGYKDSLDGTGILDLITGAEVQEQNKIGAELLTSLARAKSVFVKLQALGVSNEMTYTGEMGSSSRLDFVIKPPEETAGFSPVPLPSVSQKMYHMEFSRVYGGNHTFGCPEGYSGDWKLYCDDGKAGTTSNCELNPIDLSTLLKCDISGVWLINKGHPPVGMVTDPKNPCAGRHDGGAWSYTVSSDGKKITLSDGTTGDVHGSVPNRQLHFSNGYIYTEQRI